MVDNLLLWRAEHRCANRATIWRVLNKFRVLGSYRVGPNVYSNYRILSRTFSSKDPLLDLCDGKLDPGTAVVADLAGGTCPTHYRLLVVAVKENVDGTGGDAGTAVHADPFVNNLSDQIAEDLQSDRTSLPTLSLRTRLQRLRRRSNLRHTSLVLLLRDLRSTPPAFNTEDILVILL